MLRGLPGMWPLTGFGMVLRESNQRRPPPWLHYVTGWSLTFTPLSCSLICYRQGLVKPSAAQEQPLHLLFFSSKKHEPLPKSETQKAKMPGFRVCSGVSKSPTLSPSHTLVLLPTATRPKLQEAAVPQHPGSGSNPEHPDDHRHVHNSVVRK